jgi:hypothetical protein
VPEKNNILTEVCYKPTERRNEGIQAKASCSDCDYDMMMITMMILVLTATTTLSCLSDAGGTLLTHSAPTFCPLKTWLISAEIANPSSFEEC